MVLLTVLASLITVGVGWLSWHTYQVYLKGQQLSQIPGPPPQPGILNALLGNLADLSDNKYHRTTTRWSEEYGGVVRLRFLDTYVCRESFTSSCILLATSVCMLEGRYL